MKNRACYFLFLFCICLTQGLMAQRIPDKCATMQIQAYYDSIYPERKIQRAQFEKKVKQTILLQTLQKSQQRTSSSGVLYTIPVVVHIIHNIPDGSIGGTNIPDQYVTEQINILNQDYRRLNSDTSNTPAMFKSIAADVQIEFCLAVRDPNGDPTTGINRIYNSQASYNVDLTAGSVDDTTIKNKSYWPSDQYLNIWVCDLAGGILGYAEFPGTMPVTSDGVVIDYTAFGNTNSSRYNLGRTATHEIGHWLNLYHIWGDQSDCSGDDFCADTNPCSGTYYSDHTQGCPMPLQCGFPRMIQNYLDYSDDACMNLFTNDQKSRMQGAMTTSSRRIAIQNSLGCCNTCYVPHANFTTTQQYNVLLGQAITLTDHSTGNINTYTWSFDSGAVPSSSATGAGPQTIYYSTSGDKTVTLTTTGTYGTDSKTIIIHVVTTAPYADFFASKTTGVHVNETLSFFNSSTGSIDSYSWDFGTDAVPSTATGIGPHSVYYTSQGLKTASLTVSSATLGSDTKTKDYYISVVPTTDTTSLYIYPNPAKEVVALSTTFKSPTKVHILIFDRLGKKIFDQENAEMTSYNDIIDVKGWADGLYIIKFIAGDSNVSTWKLLVIK